eukprot:TRINITY_DN8660_c1_g1_i1.p1 TRINITY_DN8660_c1_g1~~TRINITY_DN8660_c1_g1_i1.p1  ORF type:complete len:491 (-),score=40.20 TRINITY_DN8660_c1_g1_i1:455-1927(-)
MWTEEVKSGFLYDLAILKRNALPSLIGCVLLGLPSGYLLNTAADALVRKTRVSGYNHTWSANLMYGGWTDDDAAYLEVWQFLCFRFWRVTVQTAASFLGLFVFAESWYSWRSPRSRARAGIILVALLCLSLSAMMARDIVLSFNWLPSWLTFENGTVVLLAIQYVVWMSSSSIFLYAVLRGRGDASIFAWGIALLIGICVTFLIAFRLVDAYVTSDSQNMKYIFLVSILALRSVSLETCDLVARNISNSTTSLRLFVATVVSTMTSTAGTIMIIDAGDFTMAAIAAFVSQLFDVFRYNVWLRGVGEITLALRFVYRCAASCWMRESSSKVHVISSEAVVPDAENDSSENGRMSEDSEMDFCGKLVVASNDRELVTTLLVAATSVVLALRPESRGSDPIGWRVTLMRASVMLALEFVGCFFLAAFARRWSPDLHRCADGFVLHKVRYDEVSLGITCTHVLLAMNCILLTYSQYCPVPVRPDGGGLLSLGTC